MLTFWDDTDAIKRFAGDDFSMAKYYDFDSDYLIEKEAGVRHYEVSSETSPIGAGGDTSIRKVPVGTPRSTITSRMSTSGANALSWHFSCI